MVSDPLEFPSIFGANVKGTANVKYKFYLHDAVYKLCLSTSSHAHRFPIWHFLLDFLTPLIPSMDYLLSFTLINLENASSDQEIFANSTIMSCITPGTFSRLTALISIFVFLCVTDILFTVTFLWPHLIKNVRYFLNFNLQFSTMFLVCGAITYCIFDITTFQETDFVVLVFSILNIIAFIPYVVIMILTGFISGFVVISPNLVYSSWFTGQTYVYPLYLIIEMMLTFSLPRIPKVIKIIFLSINIVFGFLFSIFFLTLIPMMYYPTNELHATKCLMICFNNFLGLICVIFDVSNASWPYCVVPIAFIIFISIVHFLMSRIRDHYMNYLKGLDSIHNLTSEFLETYFNKDEKESTYQMIIKLGLQSGSQTVTNPVFVGFVINKFPKSDFMVMYVNYLYAVIWGMDNDSYQYFLHMLSINQMSVSVELAIFETIYCFMQLAGDKPPIINKEIVKFQEIIVQFATAITNFWKRISDNKDELYEQIDTVHGVYMLGANQIDKMVTMFPFSAHVHFYKSIFLADFKKNFKEASVEYAIAENIVNNGPKYITSFLRDCQRPSQLVQNNDDFIEEHKNSSDEFKFMSVAEHTNDFAERDPNYPINDAYLQLNGNSYTASRNHLFTEAPYIEKGMKPFNILSFVFMIIEAGWLAFVYFDWKTTMLDMTNVSNLQNVCFNCSVFIDNVWMVKYDLQALNLIQSVSGYTVKDNPTLVEFLKKHIQQSLEVIQHFIQLTDLYTDYFPLYSITPPKSNVCFNESGVCTSHDYYYQFYNIGVESLRNTDFNATHTNEVIVELSDVIKNISLTYITMIHTMIQNDVDTALKKCFNRRLIFLIVTILLLVVLFIIMRIMYSNLKQQLFIVFSTLQKPVKKMLEAQFSKMLENRDKTICLPQLKPDVHYIAWLAFDLLILMPYAFMSLFFIKFSKKNQLYDYADPAIRQRNNRSISLEGYIQHLFLEYYALDGVFDDNYDPRACIHYYFTRTVKSHSDPLFIKYSTNVWVSFLIQAEMMLSIFFFFMFIWSIHHFLHKFGATRYLLFSIPSQIGRSNPVFNKIITGLPIVRSEIQGFVSEINKPFDSFTYFGLIKLDMNDKVVKLSNNVVNLLNTTPHNISDIQTALLNAGVQDKEIQQFFQERSAKNIISGAFPKENIDFLMYFTNETTIFIKDESNNKEINRKAKRAALFDARLQQYSRKNIDSSDDTVVIMVNNLIIDELRHIHKLLSNYENINFADSRFNRLILFADLSKAKDKNALFGQIFEFINIATKLSAKSNTVIGYGGKIKINSPNKKMTEISRLVGESYTRTMYFSRKLDWPDRFYCQKEFVDLVPDEIFVKLFDKPKEMMKSFTFSTLGFSTVYYILK